MAKLKTMARSAAAVALKPVRRGREVAWTAPWMRLGNYLMLGLWAHEGHALGIDRRVLRHPGNEILDLFPTFARDYLVTKPRFTDQRVKPWSGKRSDRIDDWALLRGFITEKLSPGWNMAARGTRMPNTLVVNVRRGDYYSVPEHRAEYGMPIEAYVAAAVDQAVADDGAPAAILVVSDGIAWCREHLDDQLSEVAPVTYREQGDPAGDLATLIHAERLIIPNSTFSMWGGYIGDTLRPRRVYAPKLFSRHLNDGRGEAYAPGWNIIDLHDWDAIST